MIARWKLIVGIGISLAAAGCGSPEARFVSNKRTKSLIPEVRDAVEQALLDSFGTPKNMVAWERFPVEYGKSCEGTVRSTQSGEKGNKLDVSFSSNADAEELESVIHKTGIQPRLIWVSGRYAKNAKTRIAHVASFSSGSNTLTIKENYDPPLKKNDKFVIKPGLALKEGRRLYMTHCVHCHGTSGDGDGPTAKYLEPRPRDYRLGLFKFTSTLPKGKPGEKARRDDLKRIVLNGIPGTYMPSFRPIDDEHLDQIIEYVRWLAMRGELENALDAELEKKYSESAFEQLKEEYEKNNKQARKDYDKDLAEWKQKGSDPNTKPAEPDTLDAQEELAELLKLGGKFSEAVETEATYIATSWKDPEKDSSVVIPRKKRTPAEDDPESLARGRALYLSGKAKCSDCHGVTGRGDGQQTREVLDAEVSDIPGLFDDWGREIKPRDLTKGIYRGGRRPLDLYRRIFAGIKGTPMPAFGGTLNDDEIWDLVNYVMSIPFEKSTSTTKTTTAKREVASGAHAGGRQ